MSKFVNVNSLVEALHLTSKASIADIIAFVGSSHTLMFKAGAFDLFDHTGKHIPCAVGDVLLKDAKGTISPMPYEMFKDKFVPVQTLDSTSTKAATLGSEILKQLTGTRN